MADKFWNQDHFAMRLRGVMYVHRVTQKELARVLKLNQATISRWQRSPTNSPSLDHIAAAADYLKIDPGWLAFGPRELPPDYAPHLEKPKPRQLAKNETVKAVVKKSRSR